MTLYNLSSSTNSPTRIVTEGDGTTLIVNRDIVNQVLYGDRSITGGNTNAYSIIDPLGSITVDGTEDIYVLALTGNPILDVSSKAGSWVASPAQVAAQINALGLAKDTTVQTVNSTLGTPAQNSAVQTLGGTAGRSVAQDMLAANKGATTEIAALVATGSPSGTPGGVPLLRDTTNLGSGTNANLTANATTSLLSNVNLSQPSFEAIFQLNAPTNTGTIPFAVINVQWTDTVTGLPVGAKSYVITAGNGVAGALTYYLSGPCRGNQISLKIANRDPSTAFTLTWAFNLTSHVYLVDRLLQPTIPATNPNGFSFSAGNPSKGLLFASQPTIAASGSATRLTAASNAKCKVSIDNGAQANGCAVTFNTPSTTTLYEETAAGQSLFRMSAGAGSFANQEWQMPNGPVVVTIINQAGTNSIVPSVTITAMEY